MTRRFVIDTDTASDDAVAILMALRWPGVTVDAVTAVSGNVSLEQASINARYTIELCGEETPVYDGCDRPLVKETFHAHWFHGPDGMGDMNYPAPERQSVNSDAVAELLRRFGDAPGEITLVTLGPLTNIAAAVAQEPMFAGWVKECVVMGGAACAVGNVTPAAEYNIWCDPEAAHAVFHSGMKLTMVGWEHCRGAANLTEEEMEKIYGFGTVLGNFAIDCNKHALDASISIQGDPGLGLPDPVAMAVALEPSVCIKSSEHYVDVVLDGPARGATIVDQLDITKQEPAKDPFWTAKEPNVNVVWEIDPLTWKETLYKALRSDGDFRW